MSGWVGVGDGGRGGYLEAADAVGVHRPDLLDGRLEGAQSEVIRAI